MGSTMSVTDQEMRSGRNLLGFADDLRGERNRSGNALWPERASRCADEVDRA